MLEPMMCRGQIILLPQPPQSLEVLLPEEPHEEQGQQQQQRV